MKRGNRKGDHFSYVLATLQVIILRYINLFFVEWLSEEMARYYQIASVLYDVLKTVTPGKHHAEVLYRIISLPYNMLFHLRHISYIM
jgi:hypothetical protein